jgi:hypothetical protein
LTASQDSEWFEFRCCGPQVPGTGLVEPGGTGYPPPSTGSLATTFVPTRLQDGLAPRVIAKIPAAATAARSPTRIAKILFTVAPPPFEISGTRCRAAAYLDGKASLLRLNTGANRA